MHKYTDVLGVQVAERAIKSTSLYMKYRNSYDLESVISAISALNPDKKIKFVSKINVELSGGYEENHANY